jgi:hypothetical protein
MKSINYDTFTLDELRQYVLTHREDTTAFYAYIDRSKTDGRMITVNLEDNHWQDQIAIHIQEGKS